MVRMKRLAAAGVVAAAMAALGGCSILGALSSGKGTVKAEATVPSGSLVLVFVDPRPETQMSPEKQMDLAEAIVKHLYKYRAADRFVAQQQLVILRSEHQADFDNRKIGVADVARETGADVVIHVDVIDYSTPQLSENQISHA